MTIIVQTRDEPTCSVENCALPESCHFFENDRWVPHRFKSAPDITGREEVANSAATRPEAAPVSNGADNQDGWDPADVGGSREP